MRRTHDARAYSLKTEARTWRYNYLSAWQRYVTVVAPYEMTSQDWHTLQSLSQFVRAFETAISTYLENMSFFRKFFGAQEENFQVQVRKIN